ncbi:MAG: ECF transporter S component [Oscillospiraceae bacterium]
MEKKKPIFTLRDIVIVAVMAAVCFAVTYFLRIEIPTPTGPTNLKLGNIFCLLAGLLFGGVRGGLSAGIGSMLFDLLNPVYISSAPFTFVFFFTMAFVCGIISHMNKKDGDNMVYNIIGAASGAVSYVVLYISKSVIVLMVAGSAFIPAIISVVPKLVASSINAVIAIVCSVLIVPGIKKALKKSKIYVKNK